MNAAELAALVPSIVALLTAVSGVIMAFRSNGKAAAAKVNAIAAQAKAEAARATLDAHLTNVHRPGPPTMPSGVA